MSQASKKKRGKIKKFRAFNLSNVCQKCGVKIKSGSAHHYLCQKCWRIKNIKDK